MIATILIAAAIGVLLFLAIRYLHRNGLCETCDLSGSCKRAGKGKGTKGGCAACPYYADKKKWMEAAEKAYEKRRPDDAGGVYAAAERAEARKDRPAQASADAEPRGQKTPGGGTDGRKIGG